MQYLLAKVLPVGCAFVAIAASTIFGRWASPMLASLKCPCAVESAAGVVTGTVTWTPSVTSTPPAPPTRPHSVKCGRPNMVELIEKAMVEVEAVPASAASCLTVGLFVCVCGPASMIKSCKGAVRHARKQHRGVRIGLHAEDPEW